MLLGLVNQLEDDYVDRKKECCYGVSVYWRRGSYSNRGRNILCMYTRRSVYGKISVVYVSYNRTYYSTCDILIVYLQSGILSDYRDVIHRYVSGVLIPYYNPKLDWLTGFPFLSFCLARAPLHMCRT